MGFIPKSGNILQYDISSLARNIRTSWNPNGLAQWLSMVCSWSSMTDSTFPALQDSYPITKPFNAHVFHKTRECLSAVSNSRRGPGTSIHAINKLTGCLRECKTFTCIEFQKNQTCVLMAYCGTFETPGFNMIENNFYPPNAVYDWRIFVKPGSNLKISFEIFVLEYSRGCVNDHVDTYAKENTSVIGRYCGRKLPFSIVIPNSVGIVSFVSDTTHEDFGFRAVYTSIDIIKKTQIQHAIIDFISNGSFSVNDIPCDGEQCDKKQTISKAHLKSPYGTIILLDWSLTKNVDNCEFELIIFDGPAEYTSPILHKNSSFVANDSFQNTAMNGSLQASTFQVLLVLHYNLGEVNLMVDYQSIEADIKVKLSDLPVFGFHLLYKDAPASPLLYDVIFFPQPFHTIIEFAQIRYNGPDMDNCSYGGIVLYQVEKNSTLGTSKISVIDGPICYRYQEYSFYYVKRMLYITGPFYISLYTYFPFSLTANLLFRMDLDSVDNQRKFTDNQLVPLNNYPSAWQNLAYKYRTDLDFSVVERMEQSTPAVTVKLYINESSPLYSTLPFTLQYLALDDFDSKQFHIETNTELAEIAPLETKLGCSEIHLNGEGEGSIIMKEVLKYKTINYQPSFFIPRRSFSLSFEVTCNWFAVAGFRITLHTQKTDVSLYSNRDNCLQTSCDFPFIASFLTDLLFTNGPTIEISFGMGILVKQGDFYEVRNELSTYILDQVLGSCSFEECKISMKIKVMEREKRFESTRENIHVISEYEMDESCTSWSIKTIGSYAVSMTFINNLNTLVTPSVKITLQSYPYQIQTQKQKTQLQEDVIIFSQNRTCPGSFFHFKEHCYWMPKHINYSVSWKDASGICKDNGAYLVSILNEEELSFLKARIGVEWSGEVFIKWRFIIHIGLNDEKVCILPTLYINCQQGWVIYEY